MQESEKIEFKRVFVTDLNKEVIAFANTDGGEIYIGIDDNGNIFGLENIDETELQCVNHINNTIKPDISVFVKYEKINLENKDVLKITVNEGSMVPYYISGKGVRPEGVYVRAGTSSVPATETAIMKMVRETTGDAYENARSLNQDLTFIQAEQEFTNAGIPFGDAQKRTLGIIGRDGCYTNLGLLLSDQCEHKIKFAVFEGEAKDVFKDRHDFSGSLFRQIIDVNRMIDSYNKLSSPKTDSLRREDYRDYPEEAVREALLNAVVHRDYGLGGYTLISMFSDRIEFLSIGGLVRGVEMDDIMMGVSYPRNSKLAEIFYRLHLIEAYGTGINKIKECYEGNAKQPLFESSPNAFKVTLFKADSKQIKMPADKTDKEAVVIALIKAKGEIVRKDVETELAISTPTATRLLAKMVEEYKILRIGGAKNTKYILNN